MVSCSLWHAFFFANSSLMLCCLIINLFFFLTKVAFSLLLYICHLGPCFGSGHCSRFGNPTLVYFIWAVWSPSGSLGFDYEMECPVSAVWSLGHMPFVLLICFLCNMLYSYVATLICAYDWTIIVYEFCMHGNKDIWLDLTWNSL